MFLLKHKTFIKRYEFHFVFTCSSEQVKVKIVKISKMNISCKGTFSVHEITFSVHQSKKGWSGLGKHGFAFAYQKVLVLNWAIALLNNIDWEVNLLIIFFRNRQSFLWSGFFKFWIFFNYFLWKILIELFYNFIVVTGI